MNVEIKGKTKVAAFWHERRDPLYPSHPLLVYKQIGKGTLAAVTADFGTAYDTCATFQARDVLAAFVDALFPDPVVEILGNPQVDVTLMRKNGRMFVHLINTSGSHADWGIATQASSTSSAGHI